MISIRRARPADAVAIAAVHVATWRNTYPGILPDRYLSRLSVPRQAAYYDGAIRSSAGVYVAIASGSDVPSGGRPRVVGFTTGGRSRAEVAGRALGEGEIETLYVLDDFRDRGLGRRLMRSCAVHLAEAGCRSAFLWVLRDNPNRWFYERLGGRAAAHAEIQVAGERVMQTAFVWDPIERLLETSPQVS